MRSKLSLLVQDGLKKKINTKWFKIVNIVLLVIVVALLNVDSIIKGLGGDFDNETLIYVYDNTGKFYSQLEKAYENAEALEMVGADAKIAKPEKSVDELKKDIIDKEDNDIIVLINEENGLYKSEIITYEYVDAITLQMLTSNLNAIKTNISLAESGLPEEELAKIYNNIEITRTYLTDELDENYEMMETIGNFLIPVFIMPFFFLILLVTQMIGAEINEEKTSKSMEIIISSVNPRTHFLAKMITSNLYAILQSVLLVLYIVLGLALRMVVTKTTIVASFGEQGVNLVNTFIESGMLANVLKCLPFIILMIILSFIAYSLLAGILASMTTSQEDFSQLQTPLMVVIMLGYFLSIMASTYEKSTFIIVLSCVPFISCILSPVLLFLGQVGLVEVLISVGLLLLTIYLLIKYGIRIYKVGILNYSSDKLWQKMLKSLKVKD